MLNLEKNLQAFQNLRKPDAIIYDWDNTLVDTWPLIKNAINQTMRSLNREEWSLEKVRDSVQQEANSHHDHAKKSQVRFG